MVGQRCLMRGHRVLKYPLNTPRTHTRTRVDEYDQLWPDARRNATTFGESQVQFTFLAYQKHIQKCGSVFLLDSHPKIEHVEMLSSLGSHPCKVEFEFRNVHDISDNIESIWTRGGRPYRFTPQA
jgi:hypothetical protein